MRIVAAADARRMSPGFSGRGKPRLASGRQPFGLNAANLHPGLLPRLSLPLSIAPRALHCFAPVRAACLDAISINEYPAADSSSQSFQSATLLFPLLLWFPSAHYCPVSMPAHFTRLALARAPEVSLTINHRIFSYELGASGSLSMTYFPLATLISGTPGIFRNLCFSALSFVPTM